MFEKSDKKKERANSARSFVIGVCTNNKQVENESQKLIEAVENLTPELKQNFIEASQNWLNVINKNNHFIHNEAALHTAVNYYNSLIQE
jgi:flavorubredoxin